MARHTKKEFAASLGREPKYLSPYLANGKLVADKNNLIDDNDTVNILWLQNYWKKNIPLAPVIEDEPTSKMFVPGGFQAMPAKGNDYNFDDETPKGSQQDTPKRGKVDAKEAAAAADIELKALAGQEISLDTIQKLGLGALHLLEKQMFVHKLTNDARYSKVKSDKAEGLLVPVDAMEHILARFAKATVTEFENELNDMVAQMTQRYSIPNTEAAAYRGEIKDRINRANKKAVDIAQKDIENTAAEFSEVRGKGERK